MTEAMLDAEVERLMTGGLAPLSAAILAASRLGIAKDARSFARIFGVAQALVLREVALLADAGLLHSAQDKRGTFTLPG